MVIRELVKEMSAALSKKGGENARFETECLLEHLGISRLSLLTEPNAQASEGLCEKAEALLKRRLDGEPLQYILGEWEFYGFPFKVREGVLIPRQDTETLVEVAEEYLNAKKSDSLAADLCAGSGCIGIALARLCGCRVKSYELSETAFSVLEENIALNSVGALVEPVRADVLSENTASSAPLFDLILSNPPYLTEKDMSVLQREVTFEPKMALFGGSDGLDFYRGIMKQWTSRLKKGGMIAVEIGIGQEKDVSDIFAENGITADCKKDACGVYRVVYGIK